MRNELRARWEEGWRGTTAKGQGRGGERGERRGVLGQQPVYRQYGTPTLVLRFFLGVGSRTLILGPSASLRPFLYGLRVRRCVAAEDWRAVPTLGSSGRGTRTMATQGRGGKHWGAARREARAALTRNPGDAVNVQR